MKEDLEKTTEVGNGGKWNEIGRKRESEREKKRVRERQFMGSKILSSSPSIPCI